MRFNQLKALFTILILVFFGCNSTFAAIISDDEAKEYKKTTTVFLEQVLANESTSTDKINNHRKKVEEMVTSLLEKKSKYSSDADFLEHVFYKVQRKYLKKYQPYKSFNALFDKGIYGCLTGTALYAVILDQLNFKYDIIETNFHVYLLVQSEGGEMLIESTDPLDGFVSNIAEIEKRINAVLEEEKQYASKSHHSFKELSPIGLKELVGLQLYNNAVNAYNAQNINESLSQLNEAAKYYHSKRIIEFLQTIDQTINGSVGNYIIQYEELSALVSN